MKKTLTILLLFLFGTLHATIVSNPSTLSFYKEGLFSPPMTWGFNAGFYYEDIYKGRYKDRLVTPAAHYSTRLTTYAAELHTVMNNYIGIYGLVGNSQLTLDENAQKTYTKQSLCYGGGVQFYIFRSSRWNLGADAKYFRSEMDIDYVEAMGMAFEPFTTKAVPYYVYEEYQGALILSYKTPPFVPYIGMTYLYSKITPSIISVYLKRPKNAKSYITQPIEELINTKNFGMFVGCSIYSLKGFSISVQSRFFDQDAINIYGEFRF